MSDKKDHQLYGRMLECYELRDAIKSGKYKDLSEILVAIEKRACSMEVRLKDTEGFTGDVAPCKETLELLNAVYEASKPNTVIH